MRCAAVVLLLCLLSVCGHGAQFDATAWSSQVQDIGAVLWPDTANADVVHAARARVTAEGTACNAVLDERYFVEGYPLEKLLDARLPELLLLTARTDPVGRRRLAMRYKALLAASLLTAPMLPEKASALLTRLNAALKQAGALADSLPSVEDLNACGLHRFRFESLAEGGRVYLCKVASSTESPGYGIDTVTYGVAELRVVKTLLGHPAALLRVPYNYGWAKSDYSAFWPDMSKLPKGQLLRCLFLPGGYDAVSGDIPGADGAMSEVLPVAGADDARVASMQACCDLYLESDSTALRVRLQAALHRRDDLELREFAFQMLRLYVREGHRADAIALAYDNLSDPKMIAVPEYDLSEDVSLLGDFANTTDLDAQRLVAHALGMLAASPLPEVAGEALSQFCAITGWSKAITPSLFTAGERRTLQQCIQQRLAAKLTDDERKNWSTFQEWLAGTEKKP